MYSQYMDGKFTPLINQTQSHSGQSAPRQAKAPPQKRGGELLGELTGGLSQLLGGVLKQFSADSFDAGDILLVLIILFLFLEGDNLELVITLGLMLLLGLGED